MRCPRPPTPRDVVDSLLEAPSHGETVAKAPQVSEAPMAKHHELHTFQIQMPIYSSRDEHATSFDVTPLPNVLCQQPDSPENVGIHVPLFWLAQQMEVCATW